MMTIYNFTRTRIGGQHPHRRLDPLGLIPVAPATARPSMPVVAPAQELLHPLFQRPLQQVLGPQMHQAVQGMARCLLAPEHPLHLLLDPLAG